ncbi:MAG: 4Fe-4S dicluster domain-containing protein [bacterium]
MSEELKNKVKELLKTKQIEVLIGYGRASDGISATPIFIETEEEVEKLVWDSHCVYNLANYLRDFPQKKMGIIAKGCDVKSILVLIQENQLKRENVLIIGIECSGVIDEKKLGDDKESLGEIGFDQRCAKCKPAIPQLYDILIAQKDKKTHTKEEQEDLYEPVRKFEAKSIQEKFNFWQEEFSRCIRCYACRQICPMCYCPKCVADQASPVWFSRQTNFEGNFSWNITRAMHLAGRCIDCGECERACPVGIPLRDINKKIEKDVKELFNYEAGTDTEQKPLFSSFGKDDPEDFIR